MSDDQMARVLAAIESLGTALRAEIVELRDDMARQAHLGGLRAEIVELRGDMVTRADLATLRAEMVTRAEIATLRADIMARIDRFQDRLTTEQQGGIVTLGAAERAERIAKEARTEVETLAEQLGALARQVRLLSGRIDQLERKH